MQRLRQQHRSATFILILWASLGLSPIQTAGNALPCVGLISPAAAAPYTTTDVARVETVVRTAGETLLVVTGQPQWYPVLDVVVRVLALVFAWFVRPRDPSTSSTSSTPSTTSTSPPPPV